MLLLCPWTGVVRGKVAAQIRFSLTENSWRTVSKEVIFQHSAIKIWFGNITSLPAKNPMSVEKSNDWSLK